MCMQSQIMTLHPLWLRKLFGGKPRSVTISDRVLKMG